MAKNDSFNRDEILEAYRKLKSFVYHDNFSLFLRARIAVFEATEDIENKLSKLLKELNKQSKAKKLSDYFSRLIFDGIGCHSLPKKFVEDVKGSTYSSTLISNRFLTIYHIPERYFFFIDAPIELHIISVLWIMRYGCLLDKKISQHSYAYKVWLDDGNKNKIVRGLRLFKPYYSQYQLWRDKAIKTVKALASDQIDSVMVSLDIKDYFHSVKLDFDDMMHDVHSANGDDKRQEKGLNLILKKVHEVYANKVSKASNDNKKTILPIGLLSSGIIANWYLKKFDEKIIKELNPAYYGRYVDDILIVLSNSKLDYSDQEGSGIAQQKFVEKYFIDRDILVESEDKKLRLNDYEHLYIQQDKIRLFEVDGKESNAILENFEKKIGDNSSAFWFLPEDDAVSREFNEEANILTYSDSVNKLRSITGVHTSKYGASVFLAKKIKSALLSKKGRDAKTTFQLLSFFRNRRNLDLFGLWEKAITYLIVNNQHEDFWMFYLECMSCIGNITVASANGFGEKDSNLVNKLCRNLVEYFELCFAMALALHPKFLHGRLLRKLNGSSSKWMINVKNVSAKAQVFRRANMMRHHYVVHPLLNYTVHCFNNLQELSLIERSYPVEISPQDFEFYQNAKQYSPRYIHLHEATSLVYYKSINRTAKKVEPVEIENPREVSSDMLGDIEILNSSFERFYEINYDYSFDRRANAKEEIRKSYYETLVIKENGDSSPVKCEKVIVHGSNKRKSKLSVLVANHRVAPSQIEQSVNAQSELTVQKKETLIRLLNDAERIKGDMLVLPENCTPFAWISLLIEEARHKQRAIICGLEHLNVSNVVFNFILTVLPLKVGDIHDAIVILRLKNHYSPYETFLIKELGKVVPVAHPKRYHLLKWSGVSFSVYNCFELADIEHRALFKSKVDLLIASEYNKDVNYFSNIVESVTRDVHCYFVQANSSDYGDSRVTVPSRTQEMNILRLKGGENSTVLKVTLDIKALRDFQQRHYGLQREDPRFKPTPPNFDHKNVNER